MKVKKLFAGYTQYQLLLFLLLKELDDDVIFLLPKYLEHLKENLSSKYRVEIIEREKPPLKNIFSFISYYIYIKKLIKRLNISEDVILYGDSIINYAISDKNILCRLEDGTGNYNPKVYLEDVKTLKQKFYFYIESIVYYLFFKKKLLNEKEKLFKRINRYYATEMAPKDLLFENITQRISLKKLWKGKKEEEKQEILKIFNFDESILTKLKKGKILLLTQALDNGGLISEKEKIELYKRILEKYPKQEVIIKTHPRETTDYRKIFKEYIIIDEQFPMELIPLIGENIQKVVTISSGGVNLFVGKAEIDFYGNEISERLLKKAGSLEHLYKRNAYL